MLQGPSAELGRPPRGTAPTCLASWHRLAVAAWRAKPPIAMSPALAASLGRQGACVLCDDVGTRPWLSLPGGGDRSWFENQRDLSELRAPSIAQPCMAEPGGENLAARDGETCSGPLVTNGAAAPSDYEDRYWETKPAPDQVTHSPT